MSDLKQPDPNVEVPDNERLFQMLIELRGIEVLCKKCSGLGQRTYASTATWHGGIGGSAMTSGVCDECWGTGCLQRKGANLRQLEAQLKQYEQQVKELQEQLKMATQRNRQRNLELDALHYVWCDGGCKSGVHRFGEHPPLTPQIVAAAERNTNRLRRWLVNSAGKEAPGTVEARRPLWTREYWAIHEAYVEQTEASLNELREQLKQKDERIAALTAALEQIKGYAHPYSETRAVLDAALKVGSPDMPGE